MDFKQLKKKFDKTKTALRNSCVESFYVYCRDNCKLVDNQVLLLSNHGGSIGSNIFYIMKELSEAHNDLVVYISYKEGCQNKFEAIIKEYNLKNIKLVKMHGPKYWYLLATSKFLVNDVTFHPAFIKREGQIYLNTWHGTPLKNMGLDEEEDGYLFGNMQKNFLASDYFLCPNTYMEKIMFKGYSLYNLYQGNIVNEGYPRNSIFFDKERATSLRAELNLTDKNVVVYMPTWKGTRQDGEHGNYKDELTWYLDQIDNSLDDNTVFYVKLHRMVSSSISLSNYKHIVAFPEKYETYDFLNMADCLVTDYSSVMFDFACTGKKIILFTYDLEEYLRDRGVYVDIATLPFLHAKDVAELTACINGEGTNYLEDAFIGGIVEHEHINATKKLCDYIFKNKGEINSHKLVIDKENVFIYVDNLMTNGITASAFNLLNTVDLKEKNYFLMVKKTGLKENKAKLHDIPEGVGVIEFEAIERTLCEWFANKLYFKYRFQDGFIKNILEKYIDSCYKRMYEKYFGFFKVDKLVQFTGYSYDVLNLFMRGKNKHVFVHNDMHQELYVKKNQHEATLLNSYRNYNSVNAVSDRSCEIAASLTGNKGNFRVVHNCFDYLGVRAKAEKAIAFDKATECYTSNIRGIEGVLASSGRKFITIGRFSPEKKHNRLIDAFEMYWQKHQDAQLIIIGGYGPEFGKTLKYAKARNCWENITIIKSISNPIAILRQCDLFVLSSDYEGLPVVFFEADCVKVPILSTNIDGPTDFLKEYDGGLLVDCTAQALYEGMLEFDKGNIKLLNIDFEKYNEKCVDEFKGIFK